jgi:transposase-like protein
VDTRTFVFKESTMAKTRPPYTPEFRRQMVELVRAGRSPEELAQEFEPTAQSIRNWVGQAECDAGRRGNGLTTAEREELNQWGLTAPLCLSSTNCNHVRVDWGGTRMSQR